MAAGGIPIPILNNDQLRRLASITYNQEVEAVKQIKFQSEIEVAKYIRDSRANYLSAVALLDIGTEVVRKFKDNDEVKATIARDILDYINYSTNMALQCVRNYQHRSDYLTKIRDHADELMQRLENGNLTEAEVEELAKEASGFRNLTLDQIRKLQSRVSSEIAVLIKETGVTYAELLERYQAKLKIFGQFRDLEESQKIEVYKAIIEASGRGNSSVNLWAERLGDLGTAVLLFTAALIVWDIFSSEHKAMATTAIKDIVSAAANIGGAMIGEWAGAELAVSLTSWLEVGEASLIIIGAGIVGSIAGAFLLGLFAGWLIGFFISDRTAPTRSADYYYHAPMPDGVTLARQILHMEMDTHPSA